MMSLISVVVPVYNVEKYVEKCLSSIARQNYENLEIIIVDDGSTDKSGEICDEFAKKEKRARVFHKKNEGLSNARNFGIRKARGDWIVFVDSDDFVKADYIEKMYEVAKRDDASVVVCGYNDVRPADEILSGEDAVIRLLTKQENVDIVAWNKLYRKSLFTNNGIFFPEGKKYEDTLTTYKILAKAKRVAYVPHSLYSYEERNDSIMGEGKTMERLVMREIAAKEAVEYFRNNNKLKQAAEISLLLAEYAFLDFAIFGKIEKKYGEMARKWIKIHKKDYKGNQYLTNKLRVYNLMSTSLGGWAYLMFRKIIHE